MKFWCQQEHLVTSVICCKFQKNLFEVWFYTNVFMILYMYIALGQGQTAPRGQILMSTERPYHFTHLFQVSKKSLSGLILYNLFHDLIHVYSPRAGGIQPPRDKVLMSTETSCHFDHLLLVSNHRWQVSEKSIVLPFFPYKSIRNQIWPYCKMSWSTQGHHLSKLGSTRAPDDAY